MDAPRDQTVIFLRWALLFALAYMILIDERSAGPGPLELGYVLLLLASNLILPRALPGDSRRFHSALLAVDTVLVVAGLTVFSAAPRDLLVGYFLCILLATFADSERRIAGAAFLAAGVYSLWVIRGLGAPEDTEGWLSLPFLFISTVFYGFLIRRIRLENARRVRAEARVRGLQCLLEVTRSLSSSIVTAEVLERIACTVRGTLGFARCRILLLDPGTAPTEATVVEALARRAPVFDVTDDRAARMLAVPILHAVEPLGAIVIEPGHERPLQREEIAFCQVIANAAASALYNARQYEALVEVESAKSAFLSNLSHELRTPLSSILLYAELAGEETLDASPAARTFVAEMARHAGELRSHVERLLDFSRETLGRERKQLRRVDLPELLESAVQRVRHRNAGRGIEFHLEVAPSLGEIFADGPKLERLVGHMLLNAARRRGKGTVRLSAGLCEESPPTLPNGLQPWERLLSLSVFEPPPDLEAAELEILLRPGPKGVAEQPAIELGLTVCRRLATVLGGIVQVEEPAAEGSVSRLLVPVQTGSARG